MLKNRFTRFATFLLALVMALSLFACDSGEETETTAKPATQTTE